MNGSPQAIAEAKLAVRVTQAPQEVTLAYKGQWNVFFLPSGRRMGAPRFSDCTSVLITLEITSYGICERPLRATKGDVGVISL